jgi:hypothetical protein
VDNRPNFCFGTLPIKIGTRPQFLLWLNNKLNFAFPAYHRQAHSKIRICDRANFFMDEGRPKGRSWILSLIFPFRNIIHPQLSIVMEPLTNIPHRASSYVSPCGTTEDR